MIDFDRQPTAAKTAMIAVIFAPASHGELHRPALTVLGGKTLLQWSLDCAMNACTVTEIVIVTDDNQTALAAGRMGRGHKPVRVIEMTTEFSAVNAVKRATEGRLDNANICILHVASPLRASWDIDAASNLFTETLARRDETRPLSLSSVGNFGRTHALDRLRWVVRDGTFDKRLDGMRAGLARHVYTFGGDQPHVQNVELCTLNGALTILTPQTLCQWLARPQDGMPAERLAYIMPEERSLEIESIRDLRCAQAILGLNQYTTVFAPPLGN
jgi:CMP-N-acetylneuraminic acid synthetase